jgi:phenylacetate-CoA ligase
VSQYEKNLRAVKGSPQTWQESLQSSVEKLLGNSLDHVIFYQRLKRARQLLPRCDHLQEFPPITRSDLAKEPWSFVPDNIDYSDMVIYNTTGTTGHPFEVPQHPVSVAMYGSLIKDCLNRWGIKVEFAPDHVAIALVGYQQSTLSFITRLSTFNDGVFVKINVHPVAYADPSYPCHYLREAQPEILTGDPLAFTQLARLFEAYHLERIHPKALISTGIELLPRVREFLQTYFGCPVIDWYSLTETGPIAYACPQGSGYHILPPDIHVEFLDEQGNNVQEGESGEITITGGRNRYFPLIRYRTGDWGRITFEKCACGDPMPRIIDLQGRHPVIFQANSGEFLNNADVARILRPFPLLIYEFVQERDLSIHVRFDLLPNKPMVDIIPQVRQVLETAFGAGITIEITQDPSLATRPLQGKIRPFQSHISVLYE